MFTAGLGVCGSVWECVRVCESVWEFLKCCEREAAMRTVGSCIVEACRIVCSCHACCCCSQSHVHCTVGLPLLGSVTVFLGRTLFVPTCI